MVLLRFSKSIGVQDSNMDELLDIRKALLIFVSSAWVQSCPLLVESDSTNAIS